MIFLLFEILLYFLLRKVNLYLLCSVRKNWKGVWKDFNSYFPWLLYLWVFLFLLSTTLSLNTDVSHLYKNLLFFTFLLTRFHSYDIWFTLVWPTVTVSSVQCRRLGGSFRVGNYHGPDTFYSHLKTPPYSSYQTFSHISCKFGDLGEKGEEMGPGPFTRRSGTVLRS